MQATTLRFTARLSALTVSAGALAILLLAPVAESVGLDPAVDQHRRDHLETLLVRHDVRYGMEMQRDAEDVCATETAERS